jgi:hypothetical protein
MSRKYKQMPLWFEVKSISSPQIHGAFINEGEAKAYAKQLRDKWPEDFEVVDTRTNTRYAYAH